MLSLTTKIEPRILTCNILVSLHNILWYVPYGVQCQAWFSTRYSLSFLFKVIFYRFSLQSSVLAVNNKQLRHTRQKIYFGHRLNENFACGSPSKTNYRHRMSSNPYTCSLHESLQVCNFTERAASSQAAWLRRNSWATSC